MKFIDHTLFFGCPLKANVLGGFPVSKKMKGIILGNCNGRYN